MQKIDEYFQITEAAEYIGVSRNTLRNWGSTRKIEEYRHPVNNYRLYKVTDLDKLLSQIEQPKRRRRQSK